MIRLEYFRTNAGLSQLELAEKVGMTQQRISAYELGKREPDLETLKLFADFFGITTDELLGIETKPENIQNTLNVGLSREEEGLLTQEDKDKIIEFAQFVANKRKQQQ